jgi:hypothetical protein
VHDGAVVETRNELFRRQAMGGGRGWQGMTKRMEQYIAFAWQQTGALELLLPSPLALLHSLSYRAMPAMETRSELFRRQAIGGGRGWQGMTKRMEQYIAFAWQQTGALELLLPSPLALLHSLS